MRNTRLIPVLGKAIGVLTEIGGAPSGASAAQLSRGLGIAQATCYRILRTYEAAGWIRRGANGTYQLAPGLVGLIEGHSPHRQLVTVAEPLLRTLARTLELAVKISVRSDDAAVTVARADSPAPMSIGGTVGGRFHVCIGSSGAAVLADAGAEELGRLARTAPPGTWDRQSQRDFLARVRHAAHHGWCVDRGSFHANVHTLSVPLLQEGRVIAAITALAFPSDLPESRIPEVKRALLDTARECLRQLAAGARKEGS